MFQVGVPYLYGQQWRTPPVIQPGSTELVVVPLLAADPDIPTLVSLDGCLTWRPTAHMTGIGVGVKITGETAPPDPLAWRLPAGSTRWVYLRHGEQVERVAQPVMCTGTRTETLVVAPDLTDTDLQAGIGAPSDELRLPAGTTGYLDVLTGDVYEWTDNDSEVM